MDGPTSPPPTTASAAVAVATAVVWGDIVRGDPELRAVDKGDAYEPRGRAACVPAPWATSTAAVGAVTILSRPNVGSSRCVGAGAADGGGPAVRPCGIGSGSGGAGSTTASDVAAISLALPCLPGSLERGGCGTNVELGEDRVSFSVSGTIDTNPAAGRGISGNGVRAAVSLGQDERVAVQSKWFTDCEEDGVSALAVAVVASDDGTRAEPSAARGASGNGECTDCLRD